MKILLSGGHLTPALAVIDYAQKNFPADTFVFAGRLYSQPSVKQRSWEKEEVTKRGVKFISFASPKFEVPVWGLPFLVIKEIWATFTAIQLINAEHPDVYLSFGGYLAVPLAVAAKLLHIPVVTHEQTRVAGAANQWLGKFADKIAVSFPESAAAFPAAKTVITGNPLREALQQTRPIAPPWIPSPLPNKPLLYITGGNQGSQFINVLIQDVLPEIMKSWWVIHQCGNPTNLMHYRKCLEKVKKTLPEDQQSQYIIKEWITEEELNWIYRHADGVFARSGANTVFEVMTIGIPAIFIPLANARLDEQRLNAEAMVDAHAALLLLQKDASPATLLETLRTFKKKLRSLRRNAELLQDTLPADPVGNLYQLLQQLVPKQRTLKS